MVVAVALGLWLPDERPGAPSAGAARAGDREPVPVGPAGKARPGERPGASQPGPRPTAAASAVGTVGPATPAAAAASANELGQVPVLMYHRIVAKPTLTLDRTIKEFREELVRLATGGYVPITAGEFVSGRINVPAGKHPVVLTFDDSTPEQFALDPQGRPKPDTAVGILQDVARQYPGFRPTATFYLNKELFGLAGQEAAGLRWLQQNGFELGNHTLTHKDLSQLSKKDVQKEIGDIEAKIVSLTGRNTTTLAYPFGSEPDKRSWAEKKDGSYSFQGVFLAGWKPSESPYAEDFDRLAIARVRSEGKIKENDCTRFCSTAWLEELEKNPATRYTSDGDPNTITFPRSEEDRLAKRLRGNGRIY
ncbi:polysaccharide deacetylase family protein [Actinomadura vinacea]|uniref:Polysaccharide deacetylase family protein n=1 Tax=Actinomadura vinacea TaxID=115336 RepID=A0ABN3ILP0_9ACTN